MARKDLLRQLMAEPDQEAPVIEAGRLSEEVDSRQPAPARAARGAIGAVGRSIADLKARALVDLDPTLIDPGGLLDRLGEEPEDHARLVASIRDHGQQVPVLARPHPRAPGRYEIVYGRRRVRALRELGLPVKALVRELDDRDLVLAQGQENSARRDLSFIEKANFARQMMEAGFDRATVQAALSIDKTVLSRMLSITERIPVGVIAEIGPAHGIGRDRWLAAAELYAGVASPEAEARAILARAPGQGTEARFEAFEAWLRASAASAPAVRVKAGTRAGTSRAATLRAEDGQPLAELVRRGDRLVLRLGGGEGGFGDWLTENLAALHRRWREGEAPES